MPKNYFQIEIPEPCDKKFSNMTPTQGGRFCSSCDKVIIDFTSLSDREIANKLHNNKGKICGQFRKSQLNRDIDLSIPKINSYRGKAAGILLSGVLAAGFTNANPSSPPIEIVDGQVTFNQRDTIPDQVAKVDNNENSSHLFNLKVFEKDSKETLIGANVILKGTTIGTTTDIDGSAQLSIPNSYFENKKEANIEITYIGYISQSVKVGLEDIGKDLEINVPLGGFILGDVVVKRKGIRGLLSRTKYFFQRQAWNFSDFMMERQKIRRKRRAERKARKVKRKQNRIEKNNKKNPPNKVIQLPVQSYDNQINNIFPNPFANEINIDLTAKKESDIEIFIFDNLGRKIYHAKQKVTVGQQNIKLQLYQLKLTNADYLLQIREKNGGVQSKKLIRIVEE